MVLFVVFHGCAKRTVANTLLILSAQGVQMPQAQASELPVVLIINGIHGGEVEGKEASLMLARDLLSSSASGLLEQMILLIVPLFNPDG